MKANMNTKYEFLKDEYPEYINISQMRVICKIALQTAKYLLDNKIVKAEVSNKKTWKYKIPIDNVIDFLNERDEKGRMIPKGKLTSKNRKEGYTMRPHLEICCDQENQEKIKEYFEYIFSDYSEIITRQNASIMTGLTRATINSHINANRIIEYEYNSIPKSSLIGFVCSEYYLNNNSRSMEYFKVLKGFELWL